MAEQPTIESGFPATFIYEPIFGSSINVKPKLAFYSEVRDWTGAQKQNLAIVLTDVDANEDFATITINLGEFIGLRNGAYIDTNNNPGIDKWLEDNGIAQMTGLTKQSGYCTYPLAVFNDDFLASIDQGDLASYRKRYDFHINTDEAAWVVCGKGERGPELWFFEAHLSEDSDSPTGEGYYFASWNKGIDGWGEYSGGQYWGYSAASELEQAIGETMPMREYSYRDIPYEDFDAVCFDGDIAKEREYAESFGIKLNEYVRKERIYDVTICETLKRTVQVKANSSEEAHHRVEDGWKNEVHVLGADDFAEVFFTVHEQQRDKGVER